MLMKHNESIQMLTQDGKQVDPKADEYDNFYKSNLKFSNQK